MSSDWKSSTPSCRTPAKKDVFEAHLTGVIANLNRGPDPDNVFRRKTIRRVSFAIYVLCVLITLLRASLRSDVELIDDETTREAGTSNAFERCSRGILGVSSWNGVRSNGKVASDGGAKTIVRTTHATQNWLRQCCNTMKRAGLD